MARCKIFLFTYNRNDLLSRAVKHLIEQTYGDWICEVHNDDPANTFTADYVRSLNDPRFIMVNHKTNLGGTASFNLAFVPCQEDYVSILEEDNWWEPTFLQAMISMMDRNPEINIAWSNMYVWKENVGSWENTHKTIWPEGQPDQLFRWPDCRQALGALHSTGAMIFRGKNAGSYVIPDRCELSVIESARERTFEYPIYMLSKPLANFSLTLQTNRSKDPIVWTGSQVMLLASFIRGSDDKMKTFRDTLFFYRTNKPNPVSAFFLVLIFYIKDPLVLRYFQLRDWLAFGRWYFKNIFSFRRLRKYLGANQEVYNFLLTNTIKQNQVKADK